MIVDLKSDTVTLPTEGMKKAMHDAPVGDDVYLEDPSIRKLEERTAEMLGKEAALFVPSGTMGNLISLYLACGRGNEVLAHESAHIIHYELAGAAAVAGCLPIPVPGKRGILTPSGLEPKLRPAVYYSAQTKMVEVENTGNLIGGTCYSEQELQDVYDFAKINALWVHMDGARLWNAAIATGLSLPQIASQADSVNVCFSKGLGAPVGSALTGPKDFITEARRVRKMLGGGMRQAGSLAAGALYALANHIDRLEEDHSHAKLLAQALSERPWAEIEAEEVETNILFATITGRPAAEIKGALEAQGVLCHAMGDRIRMVTHLDVSAAMIDYAMGVIREI
jgi:threonine aldolase